MSRKSAYALLKRAGAGSGFARAWTAAVEEGGVRALDFAIERAIHGSGKPVFYRGRQVGEVRRYNDALLLAALRAVARREPVVRPASTMSRGPVCRCDATPDQRRANPLRDLCHRRRDCHSASAPFNLPG